MNRILFSEENIPLNLKKILIVLICIIFLVSSFSSIVVSNDLLFSYVADEKTLSDVSFYCYDGSDDDKSNGKSVLMLREFESSRVVSDDSDISLSGFDVAFSYDDLGLCCVSDVLFGPMDSPWPMQSHDISHTGQSLYTTEDNNGAELWKFKTIGQMMSGIAIDADGVLYFGDYDWYFYSVYPDGSLNFHSSAPLLSSVVYRLRPVCEIS